jgi:hypothetical protein
MRDKPMAGRLGVLVRCWMAWGGIDDRLSPNPAILESGFQGGLESCRPGAKLGSIIAWEQRHGYRLPAGLRAWLMLSNGLYRSGPLIHPITAIGPMIPFARVPEMIVQPESWFELGNPNLQTVCIDLAYRLPGGGHPIFTSGDDALDTPPRIIARSFEEWFLELLCRGGREYWFDPGFQDFGAPWPSHRRHAPGPPLPDRLRSFAERVWPLLDAGADERDIASQLGLSRADVERIVRHLQHLGSGPASSQAAGSSEPRSY